MPRNEVRTDFVADAKQLFRTADLVEARFKSLTATVNSFANFSPASLKQPIVNLAVPDAAMKAALADVARYEKSTLDIRKQNSLAMTNLKKAETQAFANEAKAQTRAFKVELSEIEKSLKNTKTSSSLAGGLGLGSLIGGATVGLGVGFLKDATIAAFDSERAYRKLSSAATEAGFATSVLSDKNREFAKSAGLSETAAASVTAKIQQLATFSGRAGDVGKLQKSFLDLSAAKGIGSSEIDNLIGTILSGQDEGLNRLGISDPGQLQKAYAKQLGKTTDALTQQEKVQAAVNAVMAKAAIFTGANADKMQSLSGQAEGASAKLDNLYTNFGKGLTGSLEFRSALELANGLLEAMTTNITTVQDKLSKGFSPKKLAQEEANRPINQVKDAFADFLSPIGAVAGFGFDAITGKSTKEATDNFFASLGGSRERRFQDNLKLYTGESKKLVTQTKDALTQSNKVVTDSFTDSAKEAAKLADTLNKFQLSSVDTYLDFAKGKINASDSSDLSKIRETSEIETLAIKEKIRLQKEFVSLQLKSLTPAELNGAKGTELALQAVESVNKLTLQQEILRLDTNKKIKEEIEKTAATLDSLYQASNSSNPFVSVFSDADKAAKTLQETIKSLSPEMQKQATAMQQSIDSLALFNARLDNKLGTLDLRERIDELKNYQPKFDQSQADEIARRNISYGGYNPGGTYGSDLARRNGGFDKLTDKQKRDIYQVSLLSQPAFASGKRGIGDYSDNPLGDPSLTLNQRSLISKLASEQLAKNPDENLSAQRRLDKQLAVIDSLKAKTPEELAAADRKALSISSNLRPDQISDTDRNKLITIGEREALRRDAAERDAQRVRVQQAEYLRQIRDQNNSGGKQAVDINVRDRTSGGIDTETKPLATAPTAESTKNFYFNQLDFQ